MSESGNKTGEGTNLLKYCRGFFVFFVVFIKPKQAFFVTNAFESKHTNPSISSQSSSEYHHFRGLRVATSRPSVGSPPLVPVISDFGVVWDG